VIIGHMIPAGTGMRKYVDIEIFKETYGDLDRVVEEDDSHLPQLRSLEADKPESDPHQFFNALSVISDDEDEDLPDEEDIEEDIVE